MTADNEDESEAVESETHEEGMETSDRDEMTAERLRSTFHSSDMALAFERLVRPLCVLCFNQDFGKFKTFEGLQETT